MANRLPFSSCLFWCSETWESGQKVSCHVWKLSAPCSIMKKGRESVLAFCHVIHHVTSFDLGVMKLGTGLGAHTVIQFSKLYWTQPSPVKGILSSLWDTHLAITMEFQCLWLWVKQHKWGITLPLWSVKKKMQMPHTTLTWNDQSSTWNYTTIARLFPLSRELIFTTPAIFLLFRTITHYISPHHKTVSYVSLLWFKWFMTHSLFVVCCTIIVISIIWYMSHFLCSYLLQSNMILMSLNTCLSSFCIDDDHISYALDMTSFHLKHFTALLFTTYWALQT